MCMANFTIEPRKILRKLPKRQMRCPHKKKKTKKKGKYMNFGGESDSGANILRLKAVSQINVQLDKQAVETASSRSCSCSCCHFTRTHIRTASHTHKANNVRHSWKVGNKNARSTPTRRPLLSSVALRVCFSFYSISQLVVCVCVCAVVVVIALLLCWGKFPWLHRSILIEWEHFVSLVEHWGHSPLSHST